MAISYEDYRKKYNENINEYQNKYNATMKEYKKNNSTSTISMPSTNNNSNINLNSIKDTKKALDEAQKNYDSANKAYGESFKKWKNKERKKDNIVEKGLHLLGDLFTNADRDYYDKKYPEAKNNLSKAQKALNIAKSNYDQARVNNEKTTDIEKVFLPLGAGTENGVMGLNTLINKVGSLLPGQSMEDHNSETSYIQKKYQKVRQDTKGALGVYQDLAYTTGNMVPTMAMPTNGLSLAMTGATSFGNAYDQARREGKTDEQATKYGILSGSSEALLQKALGGMSSVYGKSLLGKQMNKVADKALTRIIKSPVVREMISEAGSEFTEEYLQEVLEPVFRNIAFDENNKVKFFTEEALYAGFLGALNSGTINTMYNVGNKINQNIVNTQRQNQLNLNENTQNDINIPANEKISQNGLKLPINQNINTNQDTNINENVNPLENIEEFKARKQEIRNQQVQEETNNRINTLEEQLEKQGTRILEESESQREAMIENFKEYLEEHNITNPTQQDINDSITDLMSYDNDLDFADTQRAEQLYNQYVKEYMQENNIPFNNNQNIKQQQFDIIQKSNPMKDDYHTGIRSVEDIKTLQETLNDSDYMDYDEFNPDLTRQDIENAIKSGMITVYSSYPIENGTFVSPSKMEAESYSGTGKIYSKEVPISNIAWIDPTQGQMATVPSIPTANDFKENINLPTPNKELDIKTLKSDLTKREAKIINDSLSISEDFVREINNKTTRNMENYDNVKYISVNELSKLYNQGGYRTAEQFISLIEKIKSNGIDTPIKISIDQNGNRKIENGQHRLYIANKLGLNQLPVVETNLTNLENLDTNNENWYNNTKGESNERKVNRIDETSRNGQQHNSRSNEFTQDRRANETDNRIYRERKGYNNESSNETISSRTNSRELKNSSFTLPNNKDIKNRIQEKVSKKVENKGLEALKKASNIGKNELQLNRSGIKQLKENLKQYTGKTKEQLMNPKTYSEITDTVKQFMEKEIETIDGEKVNLSDSDIRKATNKIFNSLVNNSLSNQEINEIKTEIAEKYSRRTRQAVQEELLDEMGITLEDISVGKDISALDFQRTDPIRLNEKVFGAETGKKINEATINKTKHNEAERIRFLNKERNEIKELGIKPHSKESAAVQKYGEKQYISDKGEIVKYGDRNLEIEFPDINTQNKIKRAAEVLRNKYDRYIDEINSVITDLGYDPIPKRPDYMRHFQEINDKLSKWGVPLNPTSLNENNIPTDINGLTDQFKPGKNWFASAMKRKGLKTTYDAITGIDGYLEGASNLIYHTEDIQRYRTLSKFIRDTYGQTHGMENIDPSTEEGQQRINDIFDNKLSKYVAWLDEQANSLAGKKGGIDRAAERLLGRKVYSVLDAAKKQVGSNMTGFNVRSALTNFASAVQGASKTNKLAFLKGTISTMQNIVHNDGLINKSDFLTSRFGSDQLSKKLWQKASNAGQIFMTGSDYFTANQIWRSKYYENLSKGMSESQAIKNADDFASRIMGDRSKGATAEIFNSKTLGLLTQFQLEVNNQWSSIIHDNKIDLKTGNKSGATVMFQLGQLAAMSYLFNNLMKSLTGSDVMIDPIDMLKKLLGKDDEDDEKTLEERTREVMGDLINDIPFASFMSGGRIPMSEAFKGTETLFKYATGQKDKYGNNIKADDVKKDLIESGFYWLLPTGYGQLKKTTKGMQMYDKNLPMAGSYTDSGNLRFRADESTSGKVKALLFGQYSSEESQKYRESGYKTISKSRLDEVKELEMSASEYRKYRENLNKAGTTNADKIEYIASSNYSNKEKNIMAKNVLGRDFDIKEYNKYNSYEEYDYATKYPDKYSVIKQIAPFDKYEVYKNKINEIRNSTTNDKEETIKYINSLKMNVAQKAMFIKQYYKSFNKYNKEIINYINSQKLTKQEKEQILKQLGFTIKDGRVYY